MTTSPSSRIFAAAPADLIVEDRVEACPYLPAQRARLPIGLPVLPVDFAELDRRLAAGQRRVGPYWYQPQCPNCRQCQSLRIPIEQFELRRTQRRVLSRGDRLLGESIGPVQTTADRVVLFNRHRELRRLSGDGLAVSSMAYEYMFARGGDHHLEMSYWLDDSLVAVALCDRGSEALSAVYTYYEPGLHHLSLGTYTILKQIELCRRERLSYLYLGFYVAASRLEYKAGFRPHQRLVDGRWQWYESQQS